MTRVTAEQTAEILRLMAQGLDNNTIAERVGVTPLQVRAVKAVAARKTGQPVSSSDEDLIDDAIETTFGLERDLQEWLCRNIASLHPSLAVESQQRKVASGFIDVLARDGDGTAVVIELKAGMADRDAIGQILAYMGDVMPAEKTVRGILIAGDFSPRAKAAARAARNVELRRYGIRFSFEAISPDPA
jgi:RecB family endonuclease NucS